MVDSERDDTDGGGSWISLCVTMNFVLHQDIKTIQHIQQVNLKRYQVVSVEDALAVIEDNGDSGGLDNSKERGNSSLERGLSLITRGGQAIVLSQKGKRDTLNFTLQVRTWLPFCVHVMNGGFAADLTATHFESRQASSG